MNKIIALQGVGESGKTTTIGLLRDLFLGKNWKELRYVRGCQSTKDFAVILQAGKLKVGICTWGDNVKQLDLCLPKFRKEKCEFIVCAMRTRGGTVEYVEDFAKADGTVLERIHKDRTPDLAGQARENREVARQISQLIEKEISK
ncbi:MAG TPA: hypothetical protein VFK88_05205 [Gallionella sp.]|nr:hypothetical protein [Gallionella sp.]